MAAPSHVPLPPRRRRRVSDEHNWGPPLEVKNADHWRFQWHEEVLKRFDLNRSQIAVAGVLMHAYNPKKGYAEIGLTIIARRAGCSRDTANTAVWALQNNGLVNVTNRGALRPDGSRATNRYALTYVTRNVR